MTARERILRALDELEGDELEVLALLAARLVAGKRAYGTLDVLDGRDWVHEATEESCDLAVYLAAALVKDQRTSRETARQTIARVARERLRRMTGKERGE